MKKTKMTLITAAVLTVAATTRPDFVHSVSEGDEPISTVYGPPSYFAAKGDVNMDGEINILDYCLMRNVAIESGDYDQRYISDINKDGKVNKFDIFSIQDYLLGKSSYIKPYTDDDPDVTKQTQPPVTTITEIQPQPEYGCYITVTEETQPLVTTIEESQPPVTTRREPQPQPKYGCYMTTELDEVE